MLVGTTMQLDQISIVTNFLFSEKYQSYGTSYESSVSMSAFYMQFILFVICFYKNKNLIEKDPSNSALFNFTIIALAIQSMAGMIAEMFRLAFYFDVYYILLVPRALECYAKGRYRDIVYCLFICTSLVYLFFLASANLPEYKMSIF